MQSLLRAFSDIRLPELRLSLDLPPYAQFKHRRGHPTQALDAVLHPAQHFLLLLGFGTQCLAQKKPAISVRCHQGSTEIVHRASQKVGPILVIPLDLQI